MLSAVIPSARGYPAVPLARQPEHQRSVHPGPLVLRTALLTSPTPTADRDRTVSRRSEPSSRTALIGEQPNPWDRLQPQDAMGRHRGAKPRRRCGLSGVISLGSLADTMGLDSHDGTITYVVDEQGTSLTNFGPGGGAARTRLPRDDGSCRQGRVPLHLPRLQRRTHGVVSVEIMNCGRGTDMQYATNGGIVSATGSRSSNSFTPRGREFQ